MLLTMGPKPHKLTLDMFRGASFNVTLTQITDDTTRTPVPFPEGVRVELRFDSERVWVAEIEGAEARFNVTAETVLNTWGTGKVDLFYVDGDFETPWASGKVVLHG